VSRHVVWFSCGAASAALAKIVVTARPDAEVVYCDLGRDEHEDNPRFLADVERWIGKRVTVIRSEKYASVNDVFAARRYVSGMHGAPCTVEMKKVPRFAFQRADDVHHFGYTADKRERTRAVNLKANNPDLFLEFTLIDSDLRKRDCHNMVSAAGIRAPEMYRLGFVNNNCKGCVKASSPAYWLATRRAFPDVFALRVRQSREYGWKPLKDADDQHFYLDELDALIAGPELVTESISCGPECAPSGGRS
jgi:hypothetical protein